MKNKIKEILREEVQKNSLGVAVTRPDKVLIVMRGISGGGTHSTNLGTRFTGE